MNEELKIAYESYRQANMKLNLLSGITRHDILNHVTALSGFLEISMDDAPVESREYLGKCEYITRTIQSLIEFTRVYDDIEYIPRYGRI